MDFLDNSRKFKKKVKKLLKNTVNLILNIRRNIMDYIAIIKKI